MDNKQIEEMKNIMIKKYNEKYYPLINNTSIILHSFDHAIKKAGAYDEVMNQLKILGWNDEWKSFVIEAVNYYADFLKGKHQPKLPEGSVVLSKEEYEILTDISNLKNKVQEALNINPIEELIQVEREARKQAVKEYCDKLKKVIHERDYVSGYAEIGLQEEINELAKKFGVEL